MALKGFKRNFANLKMLTEDQCEAIHRGTLRVLAETGLDFNNERALKVFADAGCKVDLSSKRVRFPQWLVEECLAKCPSHYLVKARDPKNSVILSADADYTYFASNCGMGTVDLDTWEPRQATRKDFYDFVKVLDALPNVHMMMGFPYFGFAKVPEPMQLLESNAGKIRYASKVQLEGSVFDNHIWNIEMAKAVGLDLLLFVNPGAPLTYYKEHADLIIACVEADVPLHFTCGTLAGATGPATIAGAIIVENANNIAGMALAQLIRPGARVWAGNMMFVQNMISGSPSFGAIENPVMGAVHSQMWRRYGVPSWNIFFGDSKTLDFQAGYETALSAMAGAVCGSSVIFLQGAMTAELTAHPVKAILDDDIAGLVGRFLKGIEVTEDTMAVDLINSVGPIPGQFLDKAHTREWWKKEQHLPKVADRLSYTEWVARGRKDTIDHAKRRMEEILATHKPNPLTPQQEQAIEDILKEARNYYRQKGMISDEEWRIYQEDLNSPNYPYA